MFSHVILLSIILLSDRGCWFCNIAVGSIEQEHLIRGVQVEVLVDDGDVAMILEVNTKARETLLGLSTFQLGGLSQHDSVQVDRFTLKLRYQGI